MSRLFPLRAGLIVSVSSLALLASACVVSETDSSDGLDVGTGGGVASGGASGGGTSTGGANLGGSGAGDCDVPGDACYMETGIDYECRRRFATGINYAWHSFATDFGGMTTWSLPGVAANSAIYDTELADMKQSGVSVLRWWMFPDFRGDGVTFDENDDPSGLGATTVADIQKALELAEKNDIYLVLTLFSFDNFRPDHDADSGAAVVLVRGMAPMISDATRRAKLIANVVRPVAAAVAASPNAHRLLGWDVINEPEWAVEAATPGAPSGGGFSPNPELTAVSLVNMKALINESIVALKDELPSGLTSAGWAAAKWQWAFADVTSVDFHQPHIYAWVNDYWPYSKTPTELGYTGKPTVIGEFFLTSMPFTDAEPGNDPDDPTSFQTLNDSWFTNGYAGAWSWQYNENKANLPLVKTFADGKGCQATF